MAACTQYSVFEVTQAGTTIANGTYIPYTTVTEGAGTFTIFTKDGLNSYPRIEPEYMGNNEWQWSFYTTSDRETAPHYIGTINASYFTPEYPINCPSDELLTWDVDSGAVEPGPTITGKTGGDTFGLPADTVALIVSRFGSVERFLRLRNLGQI